MSLELVDFCKPLIGKPWVRGGRGPDVFDCWGLLVYVYRNAMGIHLPDYPELNPGSGLQVSRTVSKGLPLWERIARPEHGCAVGMSCGKRIGHVGMWLGGAETGIFHAFESHGVVFQSLASVRTAGQRNVTFYKLKK